MADAETLGETTAERSALETNRMLWSILKDNIFADENQLPQDLKGQIFSLANWVDGYTAKVLEGEGELEALISVNNSIMEGLA
jgi:flagellar protein FlaF